MKRLLLLTSLFIYSAIPANNTNVYERIGAQMLKNFSITQPPKEDKKEKKKNAPLMFKMPTLSLYEKHAALFEVMSEHEQTKEQPVDFDILNPTSAADLNLYFYDEKKPEYNLIDLLYRGTTTLGKIAFARKIALPLADRKDLLNQQALTFWLINNPKKTTELKELLTQFKKHEEGFLSLWNKNDILFSPMVKRTFYGNNFKKWQQPSGKLWLELRRRGSDSLIALQIALAGATLYGTARGAIKLYNWVQNPTVGRRRMPVGFAVGVGVAGGLFSALLLWQNYQGIVRGVANMKSRMNIANHIRKRMKSMIAFNKLVHQLDEFILNNPELTELMPSSAKLAEYVTNESGPHGAFLENIESDTFKSNSYFFSNIGRVLQSIPYFLGIRNSFAPLLEAVGGIDAQIGISELYEQTKDRNNGFTMVEYLESDTPTLNIEGFWHPLLDPAIAIPNSISIGGEQSKDVVLTGPNASGKSMAIKGLTLCILLGQSIGMAPAKHVQFTPYHKITTHLNIVDSNTDSLYKAEVMRMQELLGEIDSLEPGQKALNILDEFLNSTAPTEGEAGAFGVMYALGQKRQANSIIATHYAKLTTLPRHTNNIFKNYKVSVIRRPDGTFDHTFLLEPGRSHQVIALDLMRNQGFDEGILNHADQFLRDHPTAGMEAVR